MPPTFASILFINCIENYIVKKQTYFLFANGKIIQTMQFNMNSIKYSKNFMLSREDQYKFHEKYVH